MKKYSCLYLVPVINTMPFTILIKFLLPVIISRISDHPWACKNMCRLRLLILSCYKPSH